MEDPVLRDAEAVAARAELAAINQSRIEEFEKSLALVLAKGYLEDSELQRFVEDFKDILPREEILSRITVPIHHSSASLASTRATSIIRIRISEEPLTA